MPTVPKPPFIFNPKPGNLDLPTQPAPRNSERLFIILRFLDRFKYPRKRGLTEFCRVGEHVCLVRVAGVDAARAKPPADPKHNHGGIE